MDFSTRRLLVDELLGRAVWLGLDNHTIIEILIRMGGNVDIIDHLRYSPLHHCLSEGDKTGLQMFIDAGANVNATNKNGHTPLHRAVKFKAPVVIVELLIKYCDLNALDRKGNTPLHYAEEEEVILKLLKANANPDIANKEGMPPISLAFEKRQTIKISILLGYCSEPPKGLPIEMGLEDFVGSAEELSNLPASFKFREEGVRLCHIATAANLSSFVATESPKNARTSSGYTPLHFAAAIGTEQVVAQLLVSDNPNLCTQNGRTPLHMAKDRAIIELLLGAGVSIETRDLAGNTPLHTARSAESVQALLKAGCKLEAPNNFGETPLHFAASLGKNDVVLALLQAGANPNATDFAGNTPLHFARERKCITFLAEKGAKVNFRNKKGKTPYVSRVEKMEKGLIPESEMQFELGQLAEFGADIYETDPQVRFSNLQPIHIAGAKGELQVQATLQRGGNANEKGICFIPEVYSQNQELVTPLHLVETDKAAIALIEAGGDVNAITSTGTTPLHVAAAKGHEDIVKTLIKAGADLDHQDKNHFRAIHHAILNNHDRIYSILVRAGANLRYSGTEILGFNADPNYPAKGIIQAEGEISTYDRRSNIAHRGSTALHREIEDLKLDALKARIQEGGKVTAVTAGGITALHFAVQHGHAIALKLLLDHGANTLVNAKTHCGLTPMHLAVKSGSVDYIRQLLKLGAKPNPENNRGLTPLHIAVEEEHRHGGDWYETVYKLLVSAGARPTPEQIKEYRIRRMVGSIPYFVTFLVLAIIMRQASLSNGRW